MEKLLKVSKHRSTVIKKGGLDFTKVYAADPCVVAVLPFVG